MASEFQKAIQEIRAQMATESAATVARLKEIEARFETQANQMKTLADDMKKNFEDVELSLVAQTELNLGHLDSMAGFEERLADHEAKLKLHDERLTRLEHSDESSAA